MTSNAKLEVVHLRAPKPIHFPVEEKVPASRRHYEIRTLLFTLLKYHFREHHIVGSDQFVYWRGSSPKECLAPDVFLKLGTRDEVFDSWKTWERGVFELAIEVVNELDPKPLSWKEKLRRYHDLGVSELVRFDAGAKEGRRLRAWNREQEDLVPRVVESDRTPCRPLGLHWVVVAGDGFPAALRLARDEDGRDLLPTEAEAERAAHVVERAARESAEARIKLLEAELDRRKSKQ